MTVKREKQDIESDHYGIGGGGGVHGSKYVMNTRITGGKINKEK